MNPREMFIEGFLVPLHPGNCKKRVDRVTRLAASIGVEVTYGMNYQGVSIAVNDREGYEVRTLREAEKCLRILKRRAKD